jgi:hypothetical protein
VLALGCSATALVSECQLVFSFLLQNRSCRLALPGDHVGSDIVPTSVPQVRANILFSLVIAPAVAIHVLPTSTFFFGLLSLF